MSVFVVSLLSMTKQRKIEDFIKDMTCVSPETAAFFSVFVISLLNMTKQRKIEDFIKDMTCVSLENAAFLVFCLYPVL